MDKNLYPINSAPSNSKTEVTLMGIDMRYIQFAFCYFEFVNTERKLLHSANIYLAFSPFATLNLWILKGKYCTLLRIDITKVWQKLVMVIEKKVFRKLKLTKMSKNKKCLLSCYCLTSSIKFRFSQKATKVWRYLVLSKL